MTHPRSCSRLVASLAALVLALGASGCDKDDNAVIITYRPVAAFNGYVLTGHADIPEYAGDGNDFVYYRISSITNKGKDAKDFALDYSRIYVDDDNGKQMPPMSSGQLWNGTFPANFVNQPFTVKAGVKQEFAMGADAPRFIVLQTEGTGYQRVRYRGQGAPQPVTIVIDPGAAPKVVDGMDSQQLQLALK